MTEEMKEQLGFSLAHIGVNAESEEEALKTAQLFEALFGVDMNVGRSSIFCDNRAIEITKTRGLGTHGHLAIGTKDIVLAQRYLEEQGVVFKEETRVVKEGRTIAIYLQDEIAGFAVHLLQK